MAAPVIHLTPELSLRPITAELAGVLGEAIAAIDPWARLGASASRMAASLLAEDPALTRKTIFAGDVPAGVIAIRDPWLLGPYLQRLALLPSFQGRGYGAALMDWFERQASPSNRWLWLCRSDFNTRAGAFYARLGYEEVTELTDLVMDGAHEILMRKRIVRPA